jgi:hypothetical protein
MLTNYKTSTMGLLLILIGVGGIKWGGLDALTGGAIITAGLGLMAAKDSNVTGGTREQ